jgi:hypothetical protein
MEKRGSATDWEDDAGDILSIPVAGAARTE